MKSIRKLSEVKVRMYMLLVYAMVVTITFLMAAVISPSNDRVGQVSKYNSAASIPFADNSKNVTP